MRDPSDYADGTVLGQCTENFVHTIYYASKVLNENLVNYSTTKKEFLVVVFSLENFCSYLIGSEVIIFTGHVTLKYLFTKGDSNQFLRWIILLEEFDLKINAINEHKI